MAYSNDQKLDFAIRLEAVKAGLKKKRIKYYAEAAKALGHRWGGVGWQAGKLLAIP